MGQEGKIRELAYQIWESEGKPENQAQRHWKLACDLAESEIDGYIPPVEVINPLDLMDQLEPKDEESEK